MKKKIVNGFLMLALLVSTMGTFVSCKDYDEDGFIDVRNRISNEASLRETLQKQVDNLQKALDDFKKIAVTKDELNETLAKYVTLEVYLKFVSDTEAHFALLDKAKEDLQSQIDDIKKRLDGHDTKLSELTQLINDANKAASEAKALAEEALKLAKDNAEKIKTMQEDIAKNAGDIATLNKLVENLQSQLNSITERITTLEKTVETLENTIKVWTEKITELNNRIDSIETAILSYELRITALENKYEELSIQVKNQGDSISNLYQMLQDINVRIIELEQQWSDVIVVLKQEIIVISNECKALCEEAFRIANEALITAEAANAKASNAEQLALHAVFVAESTAKTMEDAIAAAQAAQKAAEAAQAKAEQAASDAAAKAAAAEAAKAAAEAAKTAAEAAQAEAQKLYDEMKNMLPDNSKYEEVKAAAEAAKAAAEAAQATANQAKADAAAAKAAAEAADAKATAAQTAAEAAKTAAESAKTTAEAAKATAEAAKAEADAQKAKISGIEEKLAELETKIGSGCSCGDLQTQVDQVVSDLTGINTQISTIEGKVTDINTDISTLGTSIDNLKLDFANMITNIIVQATDNPVLGYFNVPLDVRTNLLMAYFGIADNKFAFPAAGGSWVNDDERFTDEEIAVMTAGSSLNSVDGYFVQNGGEAFAKDNGDGKVLMGKVYVTVNPSTVNFSGQSFTLENSQGKESQVKLTGAKKSDKLLTFGYDRTRAANNGLYESYAYMDINDANLKGMRLALNIDEIKSELKAAWNTKSKSDIASAAVDIYKAIDNVIEADAVKATWTGSDGTEHAVFSPYSIGAVTVKPLSFNTLNLEILHRGLPGRDRICNLIDEIIQQIEVDAPELNISSSNWIKFTKVEGYSADGKTLTVSYQTYIDGKYQSDTKTVTFSDEIASDLAQVIEVLAEAAAGEAQILQALLDTLNDFAAGWNDTWDNAFQEAKDNMVTYLCKYVDKAYKKANSKFRLWTLFDINLVAHQKDKGFRFVAPTKKRATKMVGEVTLYPTSNTAEYFAPAYKKYLAISNVYDASTKKALPQAEAISKAKAAAGKNFNKVIDGDTSVKMNGEAGYIYQISYAAVDYHGLKTRRKFYVQY